MIHQGYKCDAIGCESVKSAANGWYVAMLWKKSAMLMHWSDASQDDIDRGAHLCGSACALKAISEWMGNQ